MFNSQTTRIPDGVTNAAPWQTFANAGVLDPSWAHVYHNDFDTYLPMTNLPRYDKLTTR